jgi:hypothetical protein
LALLVVEQGRTIDSQRGLIREIFGDSAQLNAMKKTLIQIQNERVRAQAHGQAPSSQEQAPSPQDQLAQSPSTQSQSRPSSQVMQKDNAKNRTVGRFRKEIPQKPPTAASDTPDARRNVLHI